MIKKEPAKKDPLTGMSRWTLAQLIEKCTEQELILSQKPTKGECLLALRHFYTEMDEMATTLNFGRFKGKTFMEVHQEHPEYATWAMTEAQESTSPSQGLLSFANWLRKQEEVALQKNRDLGFEEIPAAKDKKTDKEKLKEAEEELEELKEKIKETEPRQRTRRAHSTWDDERM
eukprot:TRINITY_DN22623_c0_g2_i1.p2 TRINITY_DN22623_c0_g2~~TRINITY_DN22623_c0_g2_i1.p2  ORF type:complete len:174 (-),score=40.63 TRINITY_DN22623_c0_g2_i1:464-985(-)